MVRGGFDERVLLTVAAKVGLPPPSSGQDITTQQIVTTPLRHGGLGFTPLTVTSPPAYFASLACAAHSIRGSTVSEAATVAALLGGTDTEWHMQDTWTVLRKGNIVPSEKQHRFRFPASPSDFFSLYAWPAIVILAQSLQITRTPTPMATVKSPRGRSQW